MDNESGRLVSKCAEMVELFGKEKRLIVDDDIIGLLVFVWDGDGHDLWRDLGLSLCFFE